MITVTRVVEDIISKKPFLQEALERGIINYYALAENLLSEVKKELRKEIKAPAIMMALRRLSEKLEKLPFKKLSFDKNANLIVIDGLVEINIEKSKDSFEKIKLLIKKTNYSRGDFLTITQGMNEVMIITKNKNLEIIKNMFRKKNIIKTIKGLGAVIFPIPLDFIDTPGFFYLVTKNLAWENINIKDIVSTATELILIFDSDDIPQAFKSLKKLIEN